MPSTFVRWIACSAFLLASPSAWAQEAPETKKHDEPRLSIEGAVVCRTIDGFENYEELPNAELTSDDKLLVYYLPRHYKTVPKKDKFAAHFTQDGQVRAAGKKKVLLRKTKLMDYEAVAVSPPENIYLRNTVSLKGLPPGDYEFDIILRDENADEAKTAVTDSVKFRIIPVKLPNKSE